MTTTLLNAEVALSKDIGDYWQSTTDGAGSATTVVDTALIAKANDWITDETWVMLEEEPSGNAAIWDERKVSSLDNSGGTLTVLTFAAAPGTGIDYSLHRLFKPSDKKIALVAAAKNIFPTCFQEVWDETLVSGNWLKDGSFERWTTTTNLTDWLETTTTVTQTSTVGQYKHGSYGASFGTLAGTLAQRIADFSDLQFLRGRNATFTCQAYCDTASALRLSINDGTTQTYSSYHAGDSAWTEDNPRDDSFYVTQYIAPNATQVTFTIHYENAAAIARIDDARVISDYRGRLYIGHLSLAQNRPHQVAMEQTYYGQEEPWVRLSGWTVDKDGYLYVPTKYPSDYRLRIRGVGYLDFLVSGAASTAWTATIALDEPQIKILSAQAALYLYTWLSTPNFESGTRTSYQEMIGFWEQELAKRKAQFGMKSPPATIDWGLG